MSKTRTQKATLNILTSTVFEVISMVCAFILPRLILSSFGSTYNGIVTSITQFLTLISVLCLGVTASTRVALYKSLAEKDMPSASSIVKAMDVYMKKVGVVLLAYVLLLAVIYPLVVQTGFGYWDVFILILIIGTSSFAEYFFGITYKTFLAADQCGYITNIFMTIATILNTLISVALIRLGCSIQIVKLGSAVIFVLRPIMQNVYVMRHYKLDRHCKPDYSAIRKRGDAVAHALANIVHDHTDIVVLTIFTDVKFISVYTVYNLVMNALKKTQTILTTGIEPALGNMWAKGELEKIKVNLSLFEYIISSFVSTVFSVALVMILPFISLYTNVVHDIEYIRPDYALVIITAFAFQGYRAPYLALVQGIGHYKQTRNGAIAEAIINIVISVILVQFLGITGVAIGTLIANAFRTIQFAIYIDDHVVPRGKREFILTILWSIANIVIITIIALPCVNQITHWTWWVWLGLAVVVFLVSCIEVIISSLVFYRNSFNEALKLLRRMRRKLLR